MATRQMTPTDKGNMQTHDYAREVATVLGEQWEAEPIPDNFDYVPRSCVLRHADGYGMRIETLANNRNDRWSIRGDYSSDEMRQKRYDETLPGVTVAKSRGIQAVADAIVKRFLPVFVPRWRQMREQADDHAAYEQRRRKGIEWLAELCGEAPYAHREGFRLGKINDNDGGFWGECSAESDKSVKLEIRSCPFDLAEKVLHTLGLVQ